MLLITNIHLKIHLELEYKTFKTIFEYVVTVYKWSEITNLIFDNEPAVDVDHDEI